MIDCSKAANYLAEKRRMAKIDEKGGCIIACFKCPLGPDNNGKAKGCTTFEACYPEEAIAAVQRWSDEHPKETILTEFLKHYPNTLLRDNGTPKGVCLYELGLASLDNCEKGNGCVDCWNRSIPIEDGEADD